MICIIRLLSLHQFNMAEVDKADAYSYLLGADNVTMRKQRARIKQILQGHKGPIEHSRVGVIREKATSTVVASLHISLVADFLDQIQFPTYIQKNWRHPESFEMTGDFSTKCLMLECTPEGRKIPFHTKIWVVVLVCKGTTMCTPSPSHEHGTSPRRFCGYGIRIFAKKACPTTVIIEEFGSHNACNNNNSLCGWKFVPPEGERVALSPSMELDAFR